MSQVHPRARTTPLIRAEIRASTASITSLAEQYNISPATARKWANRCDVQDRSHRPHTLHTTLTPLQELIAVELRRTLLLPLDDLLVHLRETVNPKVSRAGLDRCLRRHGVSQLRHLLPQEEGAKKSYSPFKTYQPGFVHIDIKYLPQMPDETSRRYLFVAIDRATRWVFVRVYDDQSNVSSTDFLRQVHQHAPMKISKILTDNGTQFTDRFTSQTGLPTARHAFDKLCAKLNIQHRLIPPRHPQTNGMVERFNGRVSELLRQTRFVNGNELVSSLLHYVTLYNERIPQRALDHLTPVQAVHKWRGEHPELFKNFENNQAGLDTPV
jgi:transposase InsO family protein